MQNSLHSVGHLRNDAPIFTSCLLQIGVFFFIKFLKKKKNLNPFPNDKFYTLHTKRVTILSLMKTAKSFPKGYKTLGKGEIACYKEFLLFHIFFKTCTTELVWERVKKRYRGKYVSAKDV